MPPPQCVLPAHRPAPSHRHKEFLRHIKREYARLVGLLQAYALIWCAHEYQRMSSIGGGWREARVHGSAAERLIDAVRCLLDAAA